MMKLPAAVTTLLLGVTSAALAQAPSTQIPAPETWFVERIGPDSPLVDAAAPGGEIMEVVVAVPPDFADPLSEGFLAYVMVWRLAPGANLPLADWPAAMDRYYDTLSRQPGVEAFPASVPARMRASPSASWVFRPRMIGCADGGAAIAFSISGSETPEHAPWRQLDPVRDGVAC